MNAIALPHAAAAEDEFSQSVQSLSLLDRVPPGCDVVPLAGMVAVYDTKSHDLREGRYYVIERQRPASGMSWATYDRFNHEHGPGEPRTQLDTSREVVRAVRRPQTGDAWWFVLESGFANGPIKAWAAGHDLVGEVVGIYRPGGS